jgi:hypothetical protein
MAQKILAPNSNSINPKLSHQCTAEFLLIVVRKGMISEVDNFTTLTEAKRAFAEVARYHRYKPSEINGSDYYDVSIWKWTGERYENIYYLP